MNHRLDNLFTIYHGRSDIKLSRPRFAIAWYGREKVDLLTGKKERTTPKQFHNFLNEIHFSVNHPKTVIHLTYELGFSYLFDDYDYIKETLLGIVIIYDKKEEFFPGKSQKIKLETNSFPSQKEYVQAFKKGRKNLLNGDCYQFNLTFPFKFGFNKNTPEDFINQFFSRKNLLGAYAHVTWLPYLNKLILSNSPECLFQMKKNKHGFLCWSFPIKGSIQVLFPNKMSEAWNKLKKSRKDQAELYMISDMLRNDLARIEKPQAVVARKKIPLSVPGILHQCSLIKVELSKNITLGQIIKNIFPGGSITGAPKKRVMSILANLEKCERGFYTGSTIILDEKIIASSINIRTAEVDFMRGNLTYNAGGGITLLSKSTLEFEEMKLKLSSFLKFFE